MCKVHSRELLTKYEKNVFPKFSSFIAVINDPLINIHSQISPRIFEQIWNIPNGILKFRGTLIHEKTWSWKFSVRIPLTFMVPSYLVAERTSHKVICFAWYLPAFIYTKKREGRSLDGGGANEEKSSGNFSWLVNEVTLEFTPDRDGILEHLFSQGLWS